MRIVIDVLGAPSRSGGMRLFAEEVIRAWVETIPEDEILVVGGPWVLDAFGGLPGVRARVLGDAGTVRRVFAQLIGVGLLFRGQGADALLSVSPVVSPIAPRGSRYCVVHDWRHLKNPQEFGAGQRAYRMLWRLSVRRAAGVGTVSRKTLKETLALEPKARVRLTENGADHPRRWVVEDRPPQAPPAILTFGHHPNKRPDLVVRSVAGMPPASWELVVLGARGDVAGSLRELAASLGVGDRLRLPGFVDEADYQRAISTASVIVLASSDEGFGLPVVEGRYFGIPVVGTADSGLGAIHGDYVRLAEPTPASLGAAIADEVGRSQTREPEVLRSWSETVADLRDLILTNRCQAGRG